MRRTRAWAQLTGPLIHANPVTLQILGLCSALAVTTSLATALTMSVALTVTIAASAGVISAMRAHIPTSIRLIVQITIIAALVIMIDEILQAFAYEISKQLSIFVSLIVTNCLVLGRAETFAMHNRPWPSILDATGNGLGYSLILIVLGGLREFFGAGALLGYQILPLASEGGWYEPLQLMLLAPSGFFLLGLMVWAIRSHWTDQVEQSEFRLRTIDEEAAP